MEGARRDGADGGIEPGGEKDPDENELRDELIHQLRKRILELGEMLANRRIDGKTREKWSQLQVYTAQALNQILRDRQNRDWEKRLKDIEKARKTGAGAHPT